MKTKHERWLLDADITVDFKAGSIEFTNKHKIVDVKHLLISTALSLIGGAVLFSIFFFLSSFPVEFSLVMIPAVPILVFCMEALMTCDVKFLREISIKLRTRRVRREMKIQNPTGVIEIATHSAEPFFDVEYDEVVRKSMSRIELKKVKKIKGVKRRGIRNLLSIEIEGNPKGELIIKEY